MEYFCNFSLSLGHSKNIWLIDWLIDWLVLWYLSKSLFRRIVIELCVYVCVFLQDITSPLFDSSVVNECNSDDSSYDVCSPRPVSNGTDSGSCKIKHVKLMQKHLKSDKLCAVCGDKAFGCNFDVISCESCKAFFRRNAFKELVRVSFLQDVSVSCYAEPCIS